MEAYESMETWNMAQAYLRRIDIILYRCDEAQIENTLKSFLNWYQFLLSLYKEIFPKMRTEEKTEIKILLEILNKEVLFIQKKMNQKKPILVNKDVFMNFELCLREMLERKNLLTPKGDDPTRSYRA